MVADHLVDPGDGGEPGVPDSLAVSATKPFHEFAQTRVGHHGQVRARVSGVDRGAAIAFEHNYSLARFRQQVRGGETGDAGTHDRDVGLDVFSELRKLRECRGARPVRRGLAVLRGHCDPSSSAACFGMRRMHFSNDSKSRDVGFRRSDTRRPGEEREVQCAIVLRKSERHCPKLSLI